MPERIQRITPHPPPIDVKKPIQQFGLMVSAVLLITAFQPTISGLYGQTSGLTPSEISDEVLLDEILIEGSLIEDTVWNTPKSVSVITSADIEQTPGVELIDILSSQSGLNITSYSGNDKQSSVDIRGMGATSNSNVLVIVDGIRLNAPDLSGADLSSIDLRNIEKIEIIRGSESVIYGDGAVAGVINIYTRRPEKKSTINAKIGVGSFETRDAALGFSAGNRSLSWKAGVEIHESNGYRENGFFNKQSSRLNLDYQYSDTLSLVLLSSAASDEYGLPGPVSIDDIDSEGQRFKSNNPDDQGETTDLKLTAGFNWKLPSGGTIQARRGYRFRDNAYLLGYNSLSLASKEDQTSHIDENTKTLTVTFSRPFSIGHRKHRLKVGIDHAFSYYVRDARSQNERHNSNTDSLGAFLINRLDLSDTLLMTLGYRSNTFNGKFRKDMGSLSGNRYYWQNGDLIDKSWGNQSYNLGFVLTHDDETNLFCSLGSSFRTPNVDEFAATAEDLKPQTGINAEAGIRFDNSDTLSYSLSLFQMQITDEIYYGMDTNGETENRNYEDITLRRGLEAEFRFFAGDSLYFWGNLSWISATFEGSGKTVPLVPAEKGSFGTEITISDNLVLAVNGIIVGSQYDGNDDSNNRFKKLDAYSVFNSKLTYHIGQEGRVNLGIRNIFNTLYSTIAYSETYYPMPTRNYHCELNWTF